MDVKFMCLMRGLWYLVQGYLYGQTIILVEIYLEVPLILNMGNFRSQFDNNIS